MQSTSKAMWVLRIAVAGEFLGHGIFALQGKKDWIGWFANFGVTDVGLATQLLFLVGIFDVLSAIIILIRPVRIVLLWMVLWGFWTALLRPLVGMPIWDFVERWANWGAPLALLILSGWPRNIREWFK
ncbi:MAG: hypothetical protein A2849_02750 [Candidatus Taylorbacteria bacterium RIFCSPHIGHO2_01_FULL_51_15]|uniref:DoxX family protein n=1 Tax=Candidatus Taylorbacteria bacterium RIFCSPHIGHO2_01_FULL_51_15 TaxID=1802304 RepID=A0A1G2MD38_9BACT|nr:MAG: hypothetical protein A2849_02750 [Candidatus Taylorbacteria bacterium RIFCSPHIGHO2_01_FULL_51_15]